MKQSGVEQLMGVIVGCPQSFCHIVYSNNNKNNLSFEKKKKHFNNKPFSECLLDNEIYLFEFNACRLWLVMYEDIVYRTKSTESTKSTALPC